MCVPLSVLFHLLFTSLGWLSSKLWQAYLISLFNNVLQWWEGWEFMKSSVWVQDGSSLPCIFIIQSGAAGTGHISSYKVKGCCKSSKDLWNQQRVGGSLVFWELAMPLECLCLYRKPLNIPPRWEILQREMKSIINQIKCNLDKDLIIKILNISE